MIERGPPVPAAAIAARSGCTVAHPAATALALLALRAEKFGKDRTHDRHRLRARIRSTDSSGMDELHEQTVNLLSFQELPKNVFDVQVAFNMVARYGSAVAFTRSTRFRSAFLSTIARWRPRDSSRRCRLSRHAPVFHGHAFSIYLETDKPVAIKNFADASGRRARGHRRRWRYAE